MNVVLALRFTHAVPCLQRQALGAALAVNQGIEDLDLQHLCLQRFYVAWYPCRDEGYYVSARSIGRRQL